MGTSQECRQQIYELYEKYRIIDLMAVAGIGGMDQETTDRVLKALCGRRVGRITSNSGDTSDY